MPERPEQVALSHLMLDAFLDDSIALCDAGTGIGKTYAYLAAGAAFLRFQTDRDRLDMDGVSHLSSFDRERVCVPKLCDYRRNRC